MSTVAEVSEIDAEAVKALDTAHVMHTYARLPVVFTQGEGVWLWDTDGKRYLDFLG